MKHFQDEEYDSIKDYEFNIMSHMNDEDKELEGSLCNLLYTIQTV